MPMDDSVRKSVLAAVPSLRAFAISLCGNVDRADDLVQETMVRALANIDSFQPGTNMSAWLFTILRNLFRSEYRKRRREVEDTDGSYAETLKSHPEQHSRVEFEEFRTALGKLPPDQREALILVGALMVASASRIDWDEPRVAIPAFLTILTIPLTYSIATGLSFGIISFAVLELATGRGSRQHWMLYLLAALFLLRFVYLHAG